MPFNSGFNSFFYSGLWSQSYFDQADDSKKLYSILSAKRLVNLVAQIDMLIFSSVLKMATSHFSVAIVCIMILIIVWSIFNIFFPNWFINSMQC